MPIHHCAGPHIAAATCARGGTVVTLDPYEPEEALHLIELRSGPQGHPSYRRVAQEMARLVREVAGHELIADAMKYVDFSDTDLERLEAERAAERNRRNRQFFAPLSIVYVKWSHFEPKRLYNASAIEEGFMSSDSSTEEVFDEEELVDGFDEEIIGEEDIEDVEDVVAG